MASVKPLTLQVSDLISWFRKGTLVVNEDFQRRAVWTKQASTYLIDTLLSGMPIPKIYIRTRIDAATQESVREVVDGQQRIRAMVAFADNELRLTSRSKLYAGKRYTDLDDEIQQEFLGYILSVDQLLNADNDAVLEVFARLNSYTVILSSAEKRHAKFQTEFKWAVREISKVWGPVLDSHKVLTLRQRVRMKDDEFIAEAYRVIVEGVRDGGDPSLLKFYTEMTDEQLAKLKPNRLRSRLQSGLTFIFETIVDGLQGKLREPYQVLAMFAAYLHHKFGIESGDIKVMPPRSSLAPPEVIVERLNELAEALELEEPPRRFRRFVVQPRATSPQRIAARRIRFKEMARVFGAE